MTQKKQSKAVFTWINRMGKINPKKQFCLYVFILYILAINVNCLFALEVDEEKKTASPPAFELVEGQDGGRNPFALPKGVLLRSKLMSAEERAKIEKQMVLEAIVTTSDQKRRASISGINVEVGDEYLDRKVLEIGKDFVVLEGPVENLRLKLKRRPFSIDITDETGATRKSENSDLTHESNDREPESGKSTGLTHLIDSLKKLK